MQDDQYRTLAADGQSVYRDRGSKFLGYAFHAGRPEDVLQRVENLRKEHPKARHYCFAYRLGFAGDDFRANDDGEPAGTAGRPILGQIDSQNLVNAGVVVVRYFGGTKLGASGLIQAYKAAAAEALTAATAVVRTLKDAYRIEFSYEKMGAVMRAVERMDLPLEETDFSAKGVLLLQLPRSSAMQTILEVKARIADVSLDEARAMDVIPGVRIERLETP